MGLFDDIIRGGPKQPRMNPFDIRKPRDSDSSSSSGIVSILNPYGSNAKREETKQLIAEAKQLVSEGKDIYNRAKSSADSASERAQRAVDNYANFCRNTSNLLNSKVKPVIQRFDAFQIDARIEAPHVSSAVYIPSLSGVARGVTSMQPMPSILGMILDEYQYDKAKEQRDEAKAYKERMRQARSELIAMRDKLDNITTYIESEQEEIDELTQKVVRISEQLESAMQRTSFTQEQANHLKAIHKIASMISDQIATEFITGSLEIDRKYKAQAKTLNKINAAIPASPSIDDQAVLNFIRDFGSMVPITT